VHTTYLSKEERIIKKNQEIATRNTSQFTTILQEDVNDDFDLVNIFELYGNGQEMDKEIVIDDQGFLILFELIPKMVL
jgi:hypothetical protein